MTALVAILCVIAAAVPSALAQQTVDLASISGRVTDQTGAVVRARSVTARQTQTNVTTTATADQEGRFRLPYLRVGRYEITVRQSGFQDAVRGLDVPAGAAFELPVILNIGGSRHERHGDRGRHCPRSGAQPDRGNGLGGRGPRTLPMNGRNFLDLALLVPGVSPTNVGSTQLFPGDIGGAGRQHCRSAASAIFRTTSSSTACRPTTMPPG